MSEPAEDLAEVIDLQARRITNFRYREWLRCAHKRLHGLDESFLEDAVQLALAGPWRAWDDATPVGSQMAFTEEMLLATGDRNVRALVKLAQAAREASDALDEVDGARGRGSR